MPECDSTEIKVRGICNACYQTTARLVRKEEISWEKLEELGYVLPPSPGPPRSPAFNAITSAMETPDATEAQDAQ